MKKYYLMAIDKGHTISMNNLGKYYETIERNYDKMKKYYLMAIDKGNSIAITNLSNYYITNPIKLHDHLIKYNILKNKNKKLEEENELT